MQVYRGAEGLNSSTSFMNRLIRGALPIVNPEGEKKKGRKSRASNIQINYNLCSCEIAQLKTTNNLFHHTERDWLPVDHRNITIF